MKNFSLKNGKNILNLRFEFFFNNLKNSNMNNLSIYKKN